MRKTTALLFLLVLAFSISASGEDKHFKRIEKFPAGEQTRSIIGSFLSGLKDYNVVQYTFDAPYETVWAAVKRAARSFAKVGGRPVVAIDEDSGRVQNGRINENAMLGMGPGAWLDEFIIEASKIGAKTKVAVSRKVIQKEFTGERPIKTQFSNSNIENYLLTQIEDEIKNSSADGIATERPREARAETRPKGSTEGTPEGTSEGTTGDYSKSAPGKYINKNKTGEYLELKPDGTFYIQEKGRGFVGKYEVSGDEITLVVSNGMAAKGKLRGNTLIDDEGQRWVKAADAPTLSTISSEVLTNGDILRMVEAKLSDSVILAKVRSSRCKFDTSTDGLIKLKQAGVSDALIAAMTEAASK